MVSLAQLAVALTSIATVFVAPCGAQSPATTEPRDARPTANAGGWELIVGIAFAVDDRTVMLSEFFDRVASNRARVGVTTTEQERALGVAIASEYVSKLLAERAGETLEISGIDLDARLRDWLREQRTPLGSVGYGESLRRDGRDPLTELPRARNEFLGKLYMDRQIGLPGGAGRTMVDTYVRPGTLRARYALFAEEMQAEYVELRVLELRGDPVGGVEIARELLVGLRQQIVDGEADMAELAAEYATDEDLKRAQGLYSPTPVRQFREGALRRFVVENDAGAISEPIAWGRNGPAGPLEPIAGYRLLRIERKTRAESAPPFESAETQRTIRAEFEDNLTRRRRAAAADRLGRRAMVWTHPVVRSFLGDTDLQ